MTVLPTNQASLKFDDDFIKENFLKLLHSFNHKNILPYLHIDVLNTQKLLIKIQEVKEYGSLRDMLFKAVRLYLTLEPIG
jgi:hypothetical protein